MPKTMNKYIVTNAKIFKRVVGHRGNYQCEGCWRVIPSDVTIYVVHMMLRDKASGISLPSSQHVAQCCIRDYMDKGWFNND